MPLQVRHLVSLSLIALGLSLGAGCDEAEAEAQANKDLWAQYDEIRATALCTKSLHCCSPELRYTDSMEACTQLNSNSPLQKSVEKGDVGLDLKQARLCFDEVEAMDCERWTAALEGDIPASCSGIVLGKPLGASCTSSGECSSGQCKRSQATVPISKRNPGTCTPFAAVGEFCAPGSMTCEPGLRCALQQNGTYFCEPDRTEGAECGSDLQCASILCEAQACTQACWSDAGGDHILGTAD